MVSAAKILITGHLGQLGSELMCGLGDFYDLVGIDIDTLDITNGAATLRFLDDLRPDTVIHAAAYTDVDGCESAVQKAMSVNRDGAANIAAACRHVGARLIYYSTDYVFDGAATKAYVETDVPNPQTVYGRSKLAGEVAIQQTLTDYAIMRIAWLYGRIGKNFVKTMLYLGKTQLEAKRRGEPVKPLSVVDDQIGNPTWTADIVRQTRAVIENRLTGVLHSTAEGQCSWYRFALDIFKIARLPVELRPCTTAEFPRPAPRPKFSSLENCRLKQAGANLMRPYRIALEEFLTLNRELFA